MSSTRSLEAVSKSTAKSGVMVMTQDSAAMYGINWKHNSCGHPVIQSTQIKSNFFSHHFKNKQETLTIV